MTENYVLETRAQCPKIEPMRCPNQITTDGIGGPRGNARPLPSYVEFMLDNETEIDTCMRVCTRNLTLDELELETPTVPTSTEMAYVEGATARGWASDRQPQAALFRLLPPEHRQARFPRAHKHILRQLDARRLSADGSRM